MRSAVGCAALGVLLLVVAGTFDAEPLYVTGAALALLGAGAAGWIGAGAWGASVRARDRRAQRARGAAARRSASTPTPAGCRCRRAGSTSRCCPSPCASGPAGAPRACASRSRSGAAGGAVLAPPALVLRDPFGLAQRVVTGEHERRGARAPARLPGARRRGRGRRDARARPRRADRRGRDRDRRPAPAPRGLAGLAHPLARRSPAATG